MPVDEQEKHARHAVRTAIKNLPWLFSKEGNRKFFRHHMAQQTPEWLVAAAREGDADAFALLRAYVRKARDEQLTVPRAVHEFAFEYLLDGKPPAKPGSSSKDSEMRKQTIRILVRMVAGVWIPDLPQSRVSRRGRGSTDRLSHCGRGNWTIRAHRRENLARPKRPFRRAARSHCSLKTYCGIQPVEFCGTTDPKNRDK